MIPIIPAVLAVHLVQVGLKDFDTLICKMWRYAPKLAVFNFNDVKRSIRFWGSLSLDKVL
jgi:hypothetical protein